MRFCIHQLHTQFDPKQTIKGHQTIFITQTTTQNRELTQHKSIVKPTPSPQYK